MSFGKKKKKKKRKQKKMSDEESISFDRTTVAQVSSSSIRSFAFSSVHHLSTQKRINGVGHFLLVYIYDVKQIVNVASHFSNKSKPVRLFAFGSSENDKSCER